MGITPMLNRLQIVLGKKERFEREKEISLFELVVSLVTTFTVCNKKKTIADIWRNFIQQTGKEVSRSCIWDRLSNEKLLDFLERSIMQASFQLQQGVLSKLWSQLPFTDILIYDASPIRLPATLAKLFPGNRTNHSPACAKLSGLYRLGTRSIEWMKLAPQKLHDSKVLPELKRLKGALLLFDLGYYSHSFLHRLDEAGVWFVCRLKKNTIPLISRVIAGVSDKYIGCYLMDGIVLKGSIVEIWGIINLPGRQVMEIRLIGFRFPKSGEYRWYASNVPASMLLAQWIYPIYRLRWQIELFFKSIKSTLHADQITSGNENIALSMIYGSILTSLAADYLIIGRAVLSSQVELKAITAQRLMQVFALVAFNLARCLLSRKITNRELQQQIDNLAPLLVCPNRKHRPTSLECVVNLVC